MPPTSKHFVHTNHVHVSSNILKLTPSPKDFDQRAELISTIGAQGYKTLQDLFAPNDPCVQPVADQYYSPKPLQLAERFGPHKCTQSVSQNITDYIATLRSLSLNCGYEADPLDFTLRDIFIAGLRYYITLIFNVNCSQRTVHLASPTHAPLLSNSKPRPKKFPS